MYVAGVVAEYNPFHTGHAWHLAQTRAALGQDGAVVCVMSGHWVQRGECALTDKWTRAELALLGGADLVLELPTLWAASSAEGFARGAVGLLSATGVVDGLSFGSEDGALDDLTAAADCLNGADYREKLREQLDRGVSFAVARQAAVRRLIGKAADCLSTPNNNLAVEYLRALPQGMEAMTVRRLGAVHDGGAADGFASASAVRQWLRQGKMQRAEGFLTQPWQGDIASMEWIERAVLARLRTMDVAALECLPDSGEGLAVRILKAAGRAEDLEGLYDLAKTKRYAHARIRRLCLWAYLGLTAADRPDAPPYLRVLGMNQRGKALLGQMRKQARVPVITKPAHGRKLDETGRRLFELEARCTDLYGLCFAQPWPSGEEWRRGPVVL